MPISYPQIFCVVGQTFGDYRIEDVAATTKAELSRLNLSDRILPN